MPFLLKRLRELVTSGLHGFEAFCPLVTLHLPHLLVNSEFLRTERGRGVGGKGIS